MMQTTLAILYSQRLFLQDGEGGNKQTKPKQTQKNPQNKNHQNQTNRAS